MSKGNDFVTREHFDKTIKEKFDSVMEKLDWIIGKYQGHEDEHTLINGKLSDHSDRLEVAEDKLGITN